MFMLAWFELIFQLNHVKSIINNQYRIIKNVRSISIRKEVFDYLVWVCMLVVLISDPLFGGGIITTWLQSKALVNCHFYYCPLFFRWWRFQMFLSHSSSYCFTEWDNDIWYNRIRNTELKPKWPVCFTCSDKSYR